MKKKLKFIDILFWIIIIYASWGIFASLTTLFLYVATFVSPLFANLKGTYGSGGIYFILLLSIYLILNISVLGGGIKARKYKEKGRKILIKTSIALLIVTGLNIIYLFIIIELPISLAFLPFIQFLPRIIYYFFLIYYFSSVKIKKLFKK